MIVDHLADNNRAKDWVEAKKADLSANNLNDTQNRGHIDLILINSGPLFLYLVIVLPVSFLFFPFLKHIRRRCQNCEEENKIHILHFL